MHSVAHFTQLLEQLAPPSLQESYDNAGLITGTPEQGVTGILVSLDCTEEVINEAIQKQCNLVIAHHPIVFKGLRRLNGNNYVERTIIKAIKNDIAIYAIHTNLDSVRFGVNHQIAERIGLKQVQILAPSAGQLNKLVTYVPQSHLQNVQQALFDAGCGHVGNYDHCSFLVNGTGTFRGGSQTTPFVGKPGEDHQEGEVRIETVFPKWLQKKVITALKQSHPYEEVAYDIYQLEQNHQLVGAGMIGELPEPMPQADFLQLLYKQMNVKVIRYTNGPASIRKVAICGGAGSFLLGAAKAAKADVFVTADVKYHEFFDSEQQTMIADIGHYESEFFTKHLIRDVILEKFPTFAVLLSETNTNPIQYFYL
ncbi:MAG: Nif3-like dinuclear metal center hexameric protein [Bacteroidia bacterium]|jgi:dinuclear metal center YbgI/SA1388 family protein|nr:Nif3-like dinuclear metal center hexameric protein [Bacteroidia bacterium]